MTTASRTVRIAAALAAMGCVGLASTQPLWRLTMHAPQYPQGLRLEAFGTRVAGDVSELDILNHYIGMPPVTAPAFETALFPYGIAALLALALLSIIAGWPRRVAQAAFVLAPLVMLADLQWRLYVFGHSLNPKAPIRLAAFTPLVIGRTSMGNFVSSGMIATGAWLLIAAALMLILPDIVAHRRSKKVARAAAAAVLACALFVSMPAAARTNDDAAGRGLQARIDATVPGGIVRVPAGLYAGPIRITGPLRLVADPGAVIDGGGAGSVVTIAGNGVVFDGFTVRNSGREVTEEAAGIAVTGNDHTITRNTIRDVYFGIHIAGGARIAVTGNDVSPGERRGARPGHGISAWNLKDSRIAGNRITNARDGIYFSFTERLVVAANTITNCRYGLHAMYAGEAVIEDNRVEDNLLGAALMMSTNLTLVRNRIERHREGAAAYGVLLKDVGQFRAIGNRIIGNRTGIYAEGVAQGAGDARFVDNVVAGNDVGLALQSTAALVAAGNDFADNLTDVRALGVRLSAGMRWSEAGRGNHWSLYRGFDANGDGVGDVPYELDGAMDALLVRNDGIRAFLYTPAHRAVEAATRLFPLLRQPPVLVDAHPLIAAPAISTHRKQS
jgi:nitrous oxidase accessory protein